MKKSTLLFISLCVGTLAFAQSTQLTRIADPRMSVDLANDNMLLQSTPKRLPPATQSAGTRDLTAVALGSSSNGLTVLSNQCNVIVADNTTKVVVFVHRNNAGAFGGTSSQYRYDVSKDGGLTFTNDIGALNPNTDGAGAGGINGRYPQGALINPSNAAVPDSVYLVYEGTWHNGDGTAPANTWEGIISGVGQVDGDVLSFTEVIDSVNHGDVGIFTSLVKGLPGEYWAMAQVFDEDDIAGYPNDSSYVLIKGVWNAATRNVEWTLNKTITLPPDLAFDGETSWLDPLIAFDPTGMKGWIAIGGDFIDDGLYVYQPVFISTNDGGASWSEPTYVDLTSFDNVLLSLDPLSSGIPSTGYEAALVVDKFGNPHYVNVVGGGQDYGIQSGLNLHCYDITNHAGTWEAIQLDVDSVATFRGVVGTNVTYTEDNRCQATTTPDGSKVFFSWIDTDPSLVDPYAADNTYPNLFIRGLDVNSWQLSFEAKNATYNTDWDGKAYMPHLAPVSLRDDPTATTTIPVVIVDPAGAFDAVSNFWYLGGITFADTEFPTTGVNEVIEPSAFSVGANYPNPFNGSTQFTVKVTETSQLNVKVQNILGETFSEQTYQFAPGNHTVAINRNTLAAGVYFYTVSSGNASVTHKMVIE
ncbi:MAG: T9SS type A sorting domain-containing protein [Chitinophagaceae bacterium]|nr:T9SS type A sorting domain-containing protein [Chitinophagaceae bacterium]